MLVASYTIELDFFSGLQNPSFEITKEDFVTLCHEVMRLDEDSSLSVFDGLGFRGVILSEGNTFIYIQNRVVAIETPGKNLRFKSNSSIALKAIALFRKYDKKGEHASLIERAITHYDLP